MCYREDAIYVPLFESIETDNLNLRFIMNHTVPGVRIAVGEVGGLRGEEGLRLQRG